MSAEQDALRERTRLIRATEAEIRALLKRAGADVAAILAQQPSDYQSWYLPQIQAQIQAALKRWGDEAGDAAGNGQLAAWRGGSALVDGSIADQAAAANVSLNAALPVLDDAQLRAMTSFLTSKISNVTLAAADAINTDLGLVIMGAKSPWEAIKGVQETLGEATAKRAGMIVRTELARAYSTATQGRMLQWKGEVPGLKKKWVRSGKLHPRENHVLMDGQIRDVDQPYNLPGGGEIMYPHDPAAPASETINCGCCSVPVVTGWQTTAPAKPEDDNLKGVPLSQVKMGEDRLSAPPLRRALRDVRREIANNEKEVAVFLDAKGREVLRKTGETDHVSFTAAELKKLRGTVSLHNHPDVISFSEDDVRFAMAHQLAELHVVDSAYHYTMRPPSSGWNKKLWDVSVSRIYQEELADAESRFSAALKNGQINDAQYAQNLDDEVWRNVAARAGLRYKRRLRSSNER